MIKSKTLRAAGVIAAALVTTASLAQAGGYGGGYGDPLDATADAGFVAFGDVSVSGHDTGAYIGNDAGLAVETEVGEERGHAKGVVEFSTYGGNWAVAPDTVHGRLDMSDFAYVDVQVGRRGAGMTVSNDISGGFVANARGDVESVSYGSLHGETSGRVAAKDHGRHQGAGGHTGAHVSGEVGAHAKGTRSATANAGMSVSASSFSD